LVATFFFATFFLATFFFAAFFLTAITISPLSIAKFNQQLAVAEPRAHLFPHSRYCCSRFPF
jgi:hypothetical protein